MTARLQLALDFVTLKRALKVAEESAAAGVHILEAGTPLIKSEGLESIRALRTAHPNHTIVADLKTMDAGRIEVESAAKAGANVAMVLGGASDSTILECIEVAKNYGVQIGVDMLGVSNPVERTQQVAEWGAHYVNIHCPIDDQMRGLDPFETLRQVAGCANIPVMVAGGINSETAPRAVEAGASVVVVGGAITKAEDAGKATATILHAMETGVPEETTLFKRGTEQNLREIFGQVSSANLSDAMHRSGDIPGLSPLQQNTRIIGPAVTCRTCPGDWAKPVQALEQCKEGDVLVVDAGGIGPAIWGELASESALQRKVSGIICYGGVRDMDQIRKIGFQCFGSMVTPTAGEPKGFGEINVPIRIENVHIEPGDWIVGDDSGVVRIPRTKSVEIANRGMDVLEMENRLRREIRQASTLSEVAELLRWEKQ